MHYETGSQITCQEHGAMSLQSTTTTNIPLNSYRTNSTGTQTSDTSYTEWKSGLPARRIYRDTSSSIKPCTSLDYLPCLDWLEDTLNHEGVQENKLSPTAKKMDNGQNSERDLLRENEAILRRLENQPNSEECDWLHVLRSPALLFELPTNTSHTMSYQELANLKYIGFGVQRALESPIPLERDQYSPLRNPIFTPNRVERNGGADMMLTPQSSLTISETVGGVSPRC